MKDMTIIIPIGPMKGEDDIRLLERAVGSCGNEQQVLIVGSHEAIAGIPDTITRKKKVKCIENGSGAANTAGNINCGVNAVKTQYFSVMEFDDLYTHIWFANVEHHLDGGFDGTFGFLPLTEVSDYGTGRLIGYANEAVWASSFSKEIGYLDIDCVKDYWGFNVSGAVFRKDDFTAVGGLKESMELVFWNEFLLRALYNGKKIYVIPKIGCIHTVNRPGSLSDEYNSSMSEDEIAWWTETAQSEYMFPHDRNKKYEG